MKTLSTNKNTRGKRKAINNVNTKIVRLKPSLKEKSKGRFDDSDDIAIN